VKSILDVGVQNLQTPIKTGWIIFLLRKIISTLFNKRAFSDILIYAQFLTPINMLTKPSPTPYSPIIYAHYSNFNIDMLATTMTPTKSNWLWACPI